MRTFFYSLYGKNWKAKPKNSYESRLYTNANYDLILFNKNSNFSGVNYLFWLVGSSLNRLRSWFNSIFYTEYEWKMKKNHNK